MDCGGLLFYPVFPLFLTSYDPFKTTGFIDEKAESTRTEQFLNKKLGYDNKNKFIIIYNSKNLIATSSLYKDKIKKSLSNLKNYPIEHEIILPDR